MARILISEDDTESCQILQETLEGFGYDVVSTYDGFEALKQTESEVFDLVVTDWVMPRMDGLALCQALKARPKTSRLPVVMLTTKRSQQDIDTATSSGIDAFLAKPFRREDLRKQIAELLSED